MTITKQYSSKSSAKRALHRIFGVGPYGQNGTSAQHRFCHGHVDNDGTLTLSSTYWGEFSLRRIMTHGIDAV